MQINNIKKIAKETLSLEINALNNVYEAIDNKNFEASVLILLNCKSNIVTLGIGKSSFIARKLSATLSSTGSPSNFIHPAEAKHGDLGAINENNAIIVISNSGETEEILEILPSLKRIGAPIIAISGKANSTLCKIADHSIIYKIEKEACPLNLAPTASSTAQLVIGDCLAMALLDLKNFKAEDFLRSHPGGTLGKKPLIRNFEIMFSSDLPVTTDASNIKELVTLMGKNSLGAVIQVNSHNQPIGIFTDGDLRRLIKLNISLDTVKPSILFSHSPICIESNKLASETARLMEEKKISIIPIVDDSSRLVGIININILLKNKVI